MINIWLKCVHRMNWEGALTIPAASSREQVQHSYMYAVQLMELPRTLDSLSVFDAAIRQGVNFAPGPLFSATGRYRNFLRLNCGRRMTPELDAAVARLGRLAVRMVR
jgi:hypothetical protein